MHERTPRGSRKKKKPFPRKIAILVAALVIVPTGAFAAWDQQKPETAAKPAPVERQVPLDPITTDEPELPQANEEPEVVEPEIVEPKEEVKVSSKKTSKDSKPRKKKIKKPSTMRAASSGDTVPLGEWVKIETLTPSGDPVVLGLKVNSIVELNGSERSNILSSIDDPDTVEGVSFYKYFYSVKWISGGSLQYQSLWSDLTAYGEYGEPIVSIRPETLGWCRTEYFVKASSDKETTNSCMVTAPYDEDGAPRGVKYTREGTGFEDEGVYFSASGSS